MVCTSVPVQSTAASFDSFIAETSRRPELEQSPPGRTAGGPEVAAERDTLRNFSPGSQPRPSAAQSHRSPTASITTVTVHAANFTVIGRQAGRQAGCHEPSLTSRPGGTRCSTRASGEAELKVKALCSEERPPDRNMRTVPPLQDPVPPSCHTSRLISSYSLCNDKET